MAAPWAAEEIGRLRELYAQGYSFGAIGAKLKKTRNAVAGMCSRLNLSRPVFVKKKPPIKEPKPKREKVAVETPKTNYKTLLELEHHDCRWPIGDADFVFCAEPVVEGRPYCAKHCAESYLIRHAQRPDLWK